MKQMMPLHEKLRFMRYEKGYTQEEVAKCIGVSVNTLRSYETRPTKIPAKTVMELFKLYDCDLFEEFGVYMDIIDMDVPVIEFCKLHAEHKVKKERELHIKVSGNPMPDEYYEKRYDAYVKEMERMCQGVAEQTK